MKNEITTFSIIIIVTFWLVYKFSKLSKWRKEEREYLVQRVQLEVESRKWEMDCDNLGVKNIDVVNKLEELNERIDKLMLLGKKVYCSHPFLGWFYSLHF